MIVYKVLRILVTWLIWALSAMGFVFDGSASLLVRLQKFFTKKIEWRVLQSEYQRSKQ